MRSKLFVPGSRPELFAKAFASAADAISIDLEDAVQPSRKGEARAEVRRFLDSLAAPRSDEVRKRLIVRVNPFGGEHWQADIESVVHPALDILNVPKVECVDELRAAIADVAAVEKAAGIARPTPLLVNIESPAGLRNAAAIACADRRVMGLQLGLGDLFEPLGISRQRTDAVQSIQLSLRLAAGEAGIDAYDGAFANVADRDGFLAEAKAARELGLAGKTCIHPSQVELANAAFRPTEVEIAHARRVVEALEAAENAGRGAFMVDGRMVDGPFITRARAILAVADTTQAGTAAKETQAHARH